MAQTPAIKVKPSRLQGLVGLGLAGAVITAWLAVHVYGVFFYTWGQHSLLTAPLLMALACWLSVGLFIVAHDCMHGSLMPHNTTVNRWLGRLCLFLYAGFNFDKLNRKHHLHHRHSGTEQDPDFDALPPHTIWHWYASFFITYFSWREFALIAAVSGVYLFVLNAAFANLMAFWALPAILSSFQLFFFGTYLPHRPASAPFEDRHRARSNDYNWWLSLLSCFHFGYHHEHHLQPDVPWWRLPSIHAATEDPQQRDRSTVAHRP